MKINKFLLVFTTFVVYTLIGFIPSFKIKLAAPVETTGVNASTYYFLENFTHNWGVKLIIAMVIVIVVSILANKIKIIKK